MGIHPFAGRKFLGFALALLLIFPVYLPSKAASEQILGLSQEIGRILSPDPDSGAHFGESLDSSGHLVIIGEPLQDYIDDTYIYNAGAAYIYQCQESGTFSCVKQATLVSPDPQESDLFGMSVGISGGTAIVSAPENGATGDLNNNAGAVYVFERNQGGQDAWGLVSSLRASDSAPLDVFGSSIDIDGDWIVASAPWEDGGTGDPLPDSGALYLFHRSPGTVDPWSEIAILRASDADSYDYFGDSVAISEETIVSGSRLENGGVGDPLPESGAAYIFQRTGTELTDWNQVAILHASDAQADDWFGQFVEIDGDNAVVTAGREDGGASNFPLESGAVYVFNRNEGGTDLWGEFAILHAPDAQSYQSFGSALSLENNLLCIGAPGDDDYGDQLTSNVGAVYMYRIDYAGRRLVKLIEKIVHSDFQTDDSLGTSVASSGAYLFAGAAAKGSDPQNTIPHAGAVLVFRVFPHAVYLPAIFKD